MGWLTNHMTCMLFSVVAIFAGLSVGSTWLQGLDNLGNNAVETMDLLNVSSVAKPCG